MKIKQCSVLIWMLAASVFSFTVLRTQAQTKVLVNAFDTADEVSIWGNWFGQAYYQAVWDPSDASNDVNSGSIFVQAFYPTAGIPGSCCGPQFLLYNGNDGINPPLVGNGGAPGAALATNVQFDVRFDPTSLYDTNNNNWPTMEVGTRGVDFGQYDFGTFTISHDETNWVHVVVPIAPNASWTNIPNIFFKYFSGTFTNSEYLGVYFDNIKFTTATVPVVPPVMSIQKPTQALRIFAGSVANTYDREQLTSVDTNQSWVGGTYPVSYSFNLLSFPAVPTNQAALFRYHIFLIPLNYAGGNSSTLNEYLEYQAGNDLWLNISGDSSLGLNPGSVRAEIAWKTNLPNSNPDHVVLTITNSTAVGAWALTFTSATAGTLTAPGASPVPFSIPADAAAQFANPLIAQFGVQPDSGWGEGQWVDVAKVQTAGVASPGVPISSDFTAVTSLDTNVWDISNSAQTNSLVLAGSDPAWWVNWSYPDYGVVLGTKADLSSSVPWKTPLFYTGSTNSLFKGKMGNRVWQLVPAAGLPTSDGSSNAVKSANGFFRVSNPGPAE